MMLFQDISWFHNGIFFGDTIYVLTIYPQDPWCCYGNMDPINIPQMLAYIPAPWILWDRMWISLTIKQMHAMG